MDTASVLEYQRQQDEKEAIEREVQQITFGMTFGIWLFFGIFGVHRFLAGEWKWGLVYLFTLGGFGGLWLSDVFAIWYYTRKYQDIARRRIYREHGLSA